MTDENEERMSLRQFASEIAELNRRWNRVPPIVDDDFEERYWEFKQQLEKVYRNR